MPWKFKRELGSKPTCRYRAHLGRFNTDKEPSRPDTEGFDFGNPVDIFSNLQTLLVHGSSGTLVAGFLRGFLCEQGGHDEKLSSTGLDGVVLRVKAGLG